MKRDRLGAGVKVTFVRVVCIIAVFQFLRWGGLIANLHETSRSEERAHDWQTGDEDGNARFEVGPDRQTNLVS